MPKEVLRRGRGPAKQRAEYYEIEYSVSVASRLSLVYEELY
jgi:hypothetical protein